MAAGLKSMKAGFIASVKESIHEVSIAVIMFAACQLTLNY